MENEDKSQPQTTEEKNSKRQLESQKDVQNENKTLKHRIVNATRVCACIEILSHLYW